MSEQRSQQSIQPIPRDGQKIPVFQQDKNAPYAAYFIITFMLLEIICAANYYFKVREIKMLVKEEQIFEAYLFTNKDNNQVKFNQDSEILVDQMHIFNSPKNMWIIRENGRIYLNDLCFNNNINVAKDSGFNVFEVERSNFKQYVLKKTAEDVQKLLQLLQKRAQFYQGNLKIHLDSITKTVILLNILHENGGLITNGEFVLTQDLSWLGTIVTNPYVNRGNRGAKPQIVGFYSPQYSFPKKKENIRPFKAMQQVDKFMTLFPALQDYFISAYKDTEFISKLIKVIYHLLINPIYLQQQKSIYKLDLFKQQNIYKQYCMIAAHVVLQDKQKQLDSIKIDNYRHLAIDYFGLNSINCLYGPQKFLMLALHQPLNLVSYLITDYTQEEFYAHTGPMLYLARITPTDQLNSFLEDLREGKGHIMEGSFLHNFYYSHSKMNFIKRRKEKPFVNKTFSQWNLTKIIWVYWDDGLMSSKVNNQICVQNIRRMGALSGFKVVQVNGSNYAEYLDALTIKKIDYSLNNAKMQTFPQSKSDLVRLALLLKYGGIYMDASYIALQSFDWLINIGRYPSEFIFNRFGDQPKVFLFWHPYYGGAPGQWVISQRYNTKSQWHLGYENGFIAADKGNQFIREWFQLLLEVYLKDYNSVMKVYQQCLVSYRKWTFEHYYYLIPMDTLKCVIGRKQAQIERGELKGWQSGADYYRIWSMSSYLGHQKFKDFFNLEKPHTFDNPFVYLYSQDYVEGIIGKIRHITKFIGPINDEVNNFVMRHRDGNFESEAHSQSFFMRHMWNSSSYSIEDVSSKPRLKINT